METFGLVLLSPMMICGLVFIFFLIVGLVGVVQAILYSKETILKWEELVFQAGTAPWIGMTYSVMISSILYMLVYGLQVLSIPDVALGILFGIPNALCIWYLIWTIDFNVNGRD